MDHRGSGVIALGAGILISNWTAQRVTRPLEKLAATTMDAAKQDLTLQISAGTRDEVEILASNFSFMIQEILAQKQKLEEQLQEIRRLQQYTEKVLVTMGDGLLAIDMEARVTTVNPAARRILELPVDHSIRLKPVWDLMDPESQMAGYVREVLADPSVEKQRELGSHTGKNEPVILVNAGVLETRHKDSREIIFSLTDITALKRLEAQVRQAQRLADLGALAAGMAHEIRNPLSAIKTFVALLPRKLENPDFWKIPANRSQRDQPAQHFDRRDARTFTSPSLPAQTHRCRRAGGPLHHISGSGFQHPERFFSDEPPGRPRMGPGRCRPAGKSGG